jgi:hypothetical protein
MRPRDAASVIGVGELNHCDTASSGGCNDAS